MTDHASDAEATESTDSDTLPAGERVASSEMTSVTHRRSFLGGLAAVVGAGAAGVTALATTPEPTAAVAGDPAAFETGDDPTVTSNDGRVESVYLSPEVEVAWEDFGDGVETVTVTLAVGSVAGVDELYTETLSTGDPDATPGDVASVDRFDAGSVDGTLELALERVDATERGEAVTSAALSDATLAGGETTSTTLDVVLRADVVGGRDETTVVRTTTVDVTVENPAADAGAGGEIGIDTA